VIPDTHRDRSPRSYGPDAAAVKATLELLGEARRPLFLLGRLGRDKRDWNRRVALAERYGALVISDLKNGAVFPTRHRLHPNPPGIISCTTDSALHNGWSKDSFGRQPVDPSVPADPDLLVRALLELEVPARSAAWPASGPASGDASAPREDIGSGIFSRDLAGALRTALAGSPACLVRVPLGWDGADLEADHPLDYLGQDGGAGIGSGPGMAVGAALALEGSGRLPVAVLGDGDFLMGGTALWTAAHYRVPLLIVVANNSSFHNDVVHQERMAGQRRRPIKNSWIGQAIADPDPDLPAFARSLGFRAVDQVADRSALPAALAEAVAAVRAGDCVLVDVRTRSDGYPAPGG
jgi:thiamine pyrophosphate-dependent acetolactate synthase large subunit-like protein